MQSLIGIDKNWKQDSMIGLAIGFAFFLQRLLGLGLTIGVPVLTASSTANFLIKIGVAPIVETLLTALVFYFCLNYFFRNNVPLSILVTGLFFALLHYMAYTLGVYQVADVQGLFIGAGLFGIISTFIMYKTRSQLPIIIGHAMINLIIVLPRLVILGGV